MIVMIAYYLILNSIFPVPIRDGIVFMINAHEWLINTNLLEIYRPPLFSWIIDAIWVVNGEDWTAIKYVQMVFTIASVILLYILLRKRKGALFAFGVSALTLTNAQLFFYTSQILTEGISLFFLILTLYFFEGTKRVHWVLSGISISSYVSTLISYFVTIIGDICSRINIKKRSKVYSKGYCCNYRGNYICRGYSLPKDKHISNSPRERFKFGNSLSSFYIVNAIPIWGPAILLVPVAFLFKSTFKDKFNYVFIAWFIISLLSWSTNASNYQYRFMIQFMPAAYFLVIIAIESIIKFDRNNFIFLKSAKA